MMMMMVMVVVIIIIIIGCNKDDDDGTGDFNELFGRLMVFVSVIERHTTYHLGLNDLGK